MSDIDIIAALAEHWQDALPYFRPADLPLIAELIADIESAAADEQAAREALVTLTTLLVVRLPRDHPVRQVIARQTRLVADSHVDFGRIATMLRDLPGLPSLAVRSARPGKASDGSPAGEPAEWDDPDRRLLAGPMLTEQEVRAAGGDPGRADLIRLPSPDGIVLPAFQFSGAGEPVPIVAEVNALLDAAGDPWGVADWWLGRNAWLRGIPAELLGRVPDTDLMLAASAEIPAG
jgi:hypothetical protein